MLRTDHKTGQDRERHSERTKCSASDSSIGFDETGKPIELTEDEHLVLSIFLSQSGPFLWSVINNINRYRAHCNSEGITPIKHLKLYFL